MTPFEALYEYAPPLLHQIAETQVTMREKDQMIKTLQANLLQAQNRMKKYADNKR
jgi:hypothetical protein